MERVATTPNPASLFPLPSSRFALPASRFPRYPSDACAGNSESGLEIGIERRNKRATSASLSDSRTASGAKRPVTLRDSGPWLMNQL